MKPLRYLLYVVVVMLCAGASFALAEEVALSAFIERALTANPEIAAAEARYEAAKARISQASALDDARFEFRYDTITASMDAVMNGKTAPMRTFGVSQEFPFPTKIFLRASIASKAAQAAYAEYEEKKKEIISRVKALYGQLVFLGKSIELVKENKILLEQLARSASSRFSVGQASQQDVLKAHVEIAKMDNELILLEQRRKVTQAKLHVLLDQDLAKELGAFSLSEDRKLGFSLGELNSLARRHRSELEAMRHLLDRARRTVTLAKQEYLPDFMIKYERMERDSRLTDWAGMVGVTLPLWFWQKQNFNVKEMRAELKEMEAAYRQKENEVLFEVQEFYAELDAHAKLLELYKTAYLPQAEQTLKASLTGYEANQVDFLNVLDSSRMLLEFQLDYHNALVGFDVAWAELERAVGRDLTEKTKDKV